LGRKSPYVDDRHRRLAAIMFTEMVGFTAKAQTNEDAALKLLAEHNHLLREIFSPFHGKEIKSMGDSFLVEFDSALDATSCALEIQQKVEKRNTASAAEQRFQLRIGIHLGDVVHEGGDVLGDAVNVASRMEPLAEPGGICISGPVFDQVRNKMAVGFVKLDPTTLKNVFVPLDIYRVVVPGKPPLQPTPRGTPVRLAVLPFVNISPDPGDAYFADGLTEELISVLSQLHELRVIARTSVTPYKTAPKSIAQIGVELGVAWVLEGSVRKAGDQLRITVQLIDVGSQEHRWAERYDRKLQDIFALQDEVAQQIADRLRIRVRTAERTQLKQRAPVRSDSYLAYLKGQTLLHLRDKASLQVAKEEFQRAISLDATNARAYCGLAETVRHLDAYRLEVSSDPRASWDLVSKASELDPDLAEVHAVRGLLLSDDYKFREAELEFDEAISLNPSLAIVHYWYSVVLDATNRPEEALRELSLAEEADPLSAVVLFAETLHLVWLHRYDEAEAKLERLSGVEGQKFLYHNAASWLAIQRGDVARALKELDLDRAADPRPENQILNNAWKSLLLGDRKRCLEQLEEMKSVIPLPDLAWTLAMFYAELDDLDRCFEWFEKAVASHKTSLTWWRLDPRYAKMRADPRFDAILKRASLA